VPLDRLISLASQFSLAAFGIAVVAIGLPIWLETRKKHAPADE
jgi:hypothetical protein